MAVYNSPLHVKHIQQLADWQKDKIFIYGGRRNLGDPKFETGEVAMITESSAGYARFKKNCKFEFRTSMLPYWPDAPGAPQNTIIGGASLWVLQGHPAEEYKGVATFFTYLSSPAIQAKWRFGNFLQVRSINYDTLEAIFAGKTTAQKGLTDSVSAGNKLLRKFEKANK
jgi:sn-glycerol 3-phosphate transport system substrate-binding protein